MFRRSGLARVAVLFAGLVLSSGCAGFLAAEERLPRPALEVCGVGAEACAAEPALASDVARRLPAAGYSTIYANGMAWIGYNVATAEGGDLGVYDNGEGMAFGLAFGDGQNLKRFFELGYEDTGRHDSGTSTASHERYYAGIRRYLFPVSQDGGGRVVPFLVGGLTVQTVKGSTAIATDSGSVARAQGAGVYLGTGLEFKLGSSSQIALALDVRGSYVSYDGAPEGTGNLISVGSAVSAILHF